jgi:hypothetical protein
MAVPVERAVIAAFLGRNPALAGGREATSHGGVLS